MNFTSNKIIKIVEETPETKSFYLDKPSDNFKFSAGQHITIKCLINGEEVRRSYSLCTAPYENQYGFSVKKVKGGKMSNYLHENITQGDTLEISNPEGKFIIETQGDLERDHYFFAAGSGITPVMSMVKTILIDEPMSSCYLLYGSRSENEIIFKDELAKMVSKHQDQFYVVHTLSQPVKVKSSGFSGLLGKTKISWTGEKGRISPSKIKDFLSQYTSKSGRSSFYICGPGNMIKSIEETIIDFGEIPANIHKEYFTSQVIKKGKGSEGNVVIILDQKEHIIHVEDDETILEAAIKAKIDAPYSCTSGACSSCLAKLSSGEVKMDACYALEDDEVEDGFILTCQSRLVSENVKLTYDV
jgi:ring-1,2-phenylacetyl-CoA epoxidase subunit PaaE